MNSPSITGVWQAAMVVMSSCWTWSTYRPYFSRSSIVSHGLTAPIANTHMSSRQNSPSRSATPMPGSGSGVANVSTAQYTFVVGSYRPRVVGES